MTDNTRISKARLLREAADRIATVAADLNVAARTCAHCGHGIFENETEARLFERLSDMPNKLRRIATELHGE